MTPGLPLRLRLTQACCCLAWFMGAPLYHCFLLSTSLDTLLPWPAPPIIITWAPSLGSRVTTEHPSLTPRDIRNLDTLLQPLLGLLKKIVKNFIYDFKIVRREVLMIHSRTLTWYLTVPPDCLVDQIVGDLPVTWCSCPHSPGCQTFWSWPSSRPWCSTARCWSCTGDTSQALSGTEAAQWRVRHWCSHSLECRRSEPEINKLFNFVL